MSIKTGLLWGFVERWGNRIISLLVFIILARVLDPRDFGLVAFAKIFIDYIDMTTGQGLGLALIQRISITEDHINTAFWIIVATGLLLSGVLFLAAPGIEMLFDEVGISEVIQALSLLVLINALSRVQVALLNREQRFKGLAIRGLVMSLVGGFVGVSLAFQGYGVWSLVFQQLSGAFAALLILWGSVTWRPSFLLSFDSARDLYSFSKYIVVEKQILYLTDRLDEIFVSVFFGATMLGYYSVAKRLVSTIVDMIYTVLSRVLIANFARVQNDYELIMAKANKATELFAAFAFPIFIFCTITGFYLVPIVLGAKWDASILLFSILVISGIFLLTPSIVHMIFQSVGKPEVTLKLHSVRLLLTMVFLSAGAFFGLTGIAIGILLRALVGALLDLLQLKRVMSLPYIVNITIQAKYVAACFPMIAAILVIAEFMPEQSPSIVGLSILTFFGAIVYLVTLIAMKSTVLSYLRNIYS